MMLTAQYNDAAMISHDRILVLDIETTGLFTADGHRILDIGIVEMKDGKPTGVEFYALVNPERDIPAEVTAIHGITAEKVAGQPVFAAIAQQLRDFIGDGPLYITCRTKDDGYTLDIAFVAMELAKAGIAPIPDAQWVNVRRWSEALFGTDKATLNAVADFYNVPRGDRDAANHNGMADARLLAAVLPKLEADYSKYVETGHKPSPRPATPVQPPAP